MHKRCISPVYWLVPSLDAGCLEPLAVVDLFALVAADLLALVVAGLLALIASDLLNSLAETS